MNIQVKIIKITNNQITNYRLRICLVIVIWLLDIDIYLVLGKLVIEIYLVIVIW